MAVTYTEWMDPEEPRDTTTHDYGGYYGEWPNGSITWDGPDPRPPIPPAPDPPNPPPGGDAPVPRPIKRPKPPLPPVL